MATHKEDVIMGLDCEIDLDKIITLVSNDGQKFELTLRIARMSEFIKIATDGDIDTTEINVDVTGDVLSSIIEYLTYHEVIEPSDIKKPLETNNLNDVVKDVWDVKWISQFNPKELVYFIKCVNYMDIEPLLELGCAKIASIIKGKSGVAIQQLFFK